MTRPTVFALLVFSCFTSRSSLADVDAIITVYRMERLAEVVVGATPEIYIDGPLTDAVSTKFVETIAVQQITNGTVYLNSPGGNLLAGIELGRQIRKQGLSTRIGARGRKYGESRPGECYSSCVLAYVGGHYRFAAPDAAIGVHRFSTRSPSRGDLDIAQVVSAAITNYLTEMGIDIGLFDRMVRAGANEILLLSPAEARSLRVVNDGILPATWELQNVQGTIYLKGEQETWRGVGKFMLACQKGQLIASAFYEAGTNAALIAASTSRYSLRIDDHFSPVPSLLRPVEVAKDYVVAFLSVTDDQLKGILAASSIGFAFHPQNPDIFYGFQVEAKSGRGKIANFIAFCSSQRP